MIVNDARGTLKHVLSSLVEWRLVFAVICWNYARLGGAGKGPAGRSLLVANVFIRSRVMSESHISLRDSERPVRYILQIHAVLQGPTFWPGIKNDYSR